MVSTLRSSNSSTFLALPLEIRQEVYRLCTPEHLCFDCSGNMYDQNRHQDCESLGGSSTDGQDSEEEDEYEPTKLDDYCDLSRRHHPRIPPSHQSALPGLLLVCHQITEEVTEMLYGKNTFIVDVHGRDQSNLPGLFRSETREKMRKIILVLRPVGARYNPSFRMDPKIWDCVLGSLSILGIIAEHPEQPASYAWPRGEPQDVLEQWTVWLTPILEYLGRALSRTAQVVVDANKEEDTVRILNNVMPGRCHFQRLRAADCMFGRGEFSPESGYWDDDDGSIGYWDMTRADEDYDDYYRSD